MMLTCDETFECLTDPIHRHNEAVERHLDDCPRCRDMADALEPALDLFDEAADIEAWEFPVSSGEYGLEERAQPDLAPSGAAPRPWARHDIRQSRSRNDGLTVAIFLVLVATMTAALVNVARNQESASAVAITLPPGCQRTQATESASDNVIAGCVACHLKTELLAGMEPVQRQHAQALVHRCVECHLDIAMSAADSELSGADARSVSSRSVLANCLFGRGS